MPDIFTPEKRSEVMRAIKSKNTGIEKTLFSIAKGFWPVCRYLKHFKVAGVARADLWFPSKKVAVFVDGDFWHGKDFESRQEKLQPYWKEKITKNMARDVRQTAELEAAGIRVLRFWGTFMQKYPEEIAKTLALELGILYDESEPLWKPEQKPRKKRKK